LPSLLNNLWLKRKQKRAVTTGSLPKTITKLNPAVKNQAKLFSGADRQAKGST